MSPMLTCSSTICCEPRSHRCEMSNYVYYANPQPQGDRSGWIEEVILKDPGDLPAGQEVQGQTIRLINAHEPPRVTRVADTRDLDPVQDRSVDAFDTAGGRRLPAQFRFRSKREPTWPNPAVPRRYSNPGAIPTRRPYVRDRARTPRQFGEFVAVYDCHACRYLSARSCSALLGALRLWQVHVAEDVWPVSRNRAAAVCMIDGVDMSPDLPPYDRPVNMMFQSYALFPHMTVAQNVAFGLQARTKLPSQVVRPRTASDEMPWSSCKLDTVRPSANLISSPVASVSVSRWRAAWSNAPNCCCWTNRLARSRQEAEGAHTVRADEHPGTGRRHVRRGHPRSGRKP